ncbi:MAG: hypothetical protein HZC40_15685 [Chloroflexi bacterium]|nr:hypothetical protein [Chloroflexota bacterium]
MEHKPRSLIGPLILITLGVLILLANLGYLPFSIWQIAAQYWPLILILVGLDIIFGRRSWLGALAILVLWIAVIGGVLWLAFTQASGLVPMGATTTEQINQALGDIKTATIELNAGASSVFVTALGSDTANLMEGKFAHPESTRIEKKYSVNGTEGRLALNEEGNKITPLNASSSRWDVALYAGIPLAIRVNGGIGNVNLDLGALTVTSLDINAGVGSVSALAPKTGATKIKINGGVGNATITIPPGVAAHIRADSGLGGIRIDETRFPKAGKIYESADFASAANKIEIEVDGGVGSVTIR